MRDSTAAAAAASNTAARNAQACDDTEPPDSFSLELAAAEVYAEGAPRPPRPAWCFPLLAAAVRSTMPVDSITACGLWLMKIQPC
jgi:hypothetical protein